MNYPEYVLRRSEALWRELEEAWQRELSAAAGVTCGSGTDAGTVEGENAEEESARGGNAMKRLAEKIFPTNDEAAAEAVQMLAAQERGARGIAEVYGASGTRGGSDGARWLADELRRGTTEGIVPARVREYDAVFAPTRETADLQTLSQSVERDARRYDGGFLLY